VPVDPAIPARVTFVPLDDLNGDRVGFGPASVYVEYCLLPLIGPSSYLLYRHVAPLIRGSGRAEVDLVELGRNLGLGAKIGRNSAVVKALDRLEAFRLGAWQRDARYALRLTVAPLTDRQAQRLPHLARTVHYRTVGMDADAGSGATTPNRPRPLR
jgi:hypothetical protein